MPDLKGKIIISCAVTGSIHTPSMSQYLPTTPEQIAEDAIGAAEAGAAILHLHARNPENGKPEQTPEAFMRFVPVIRQRTNAVLNLTNAATFGEFAEQIRAGAPSEVLVMPQFHDPLVVRIVHGLWDVLEDHPEHAEGRVRWSQRVYRQCWDNEVRPFEHFFTKGEPFLMRQLLRAARFTASQKLRPAWQKVTYGSDMAL